MLLCCHVPPASPLPCKPKPTSGVASYSTSINTPSLSLLTSATVFYPIHTLLPTFLYGQRYYRNHAFSHREHARLHHGPRKDTRSLSHVQVSHRPVRGRMPHLLRGVVCQPSSSYSTELSPCHMRALSCPNEPVKHEQPQQVPNVPHCLDRKRKSDNQCIVRPCRYTWTTFCETSSADTSLGQGDRRRRNTLYLERLAQRGMDIMHLLNAKLSRSMRA
jgi:hypothetical protein